jgi:hypothetical protein
MDLGSITITPTHLSLVLRSEAVGTDGDDGEGKEIKQFEMWSCASGIKILTPKTVPRMTLRSEFPNKKKQLLARGQHLLRMYTAVS